MIKPDGELEIRFVLPACTRSYFGEHLARMIAGDQAKAPEGCEKMIFSRFGKARLGVGMEVAHRERVNDHAVQQGVRKRVLGGNAVLRFIARRLHEGESLAVDAQLVFDRVLEITL